MIPDLGSSRGETTTSRIGFEPGNVQERLTRGTERTTGLMVGYEIMKVSKQVVEWTGPCTSGWRLVQVQSTSLSLYYYQ